MPTGVYPHERKKVNPDIIVDLYVNAKKTGHEIAKLMGIADPLIYRVLKERGVTRSLGEAQKVSAETGNKIKNWRNQFSSASQNKRKLSRGYAVINMPPNHPFYMMGQSSNTHTRYMRSVFEHRLIMAEHLGRPLEKYEMVHHLNGIKSDNRIKNLALVSRNNHPDKTFMRLLQKHIRELEAELSQQKLL